MIHKHFVVMESLGSALSRKPVRHIAASTRSITFFCHRTNCLGVVTKPGDGAKICQRCAKRAAEILLMLGNTK